MLCTPYRVASMDNVIISLPEIVEQFGLTTRAVRGWIERGLLKPVRREGRGRGGAMWFARGEVGSLVYGLCVVCGNGFKRGSIKARYCSKSCRQKSSRMHAGRVRAMPEPS
jgi:hypothetical protein